MYHIHSWTLAELHLWCRQTYIQNGSVYKSIIHSIILKFTFKVQIFHQINAVRLLASAHFAQSISSIDILKCINFELKWWTNIDRCTQIWLSDKNDMQWHWSTESEYAHCGFSIKICPMFDTKLNSCSSFSVAGNSIILIAWKKSNPFEMVFLSHSLPLSPFSSGPY